MNFPTLKLTLVIALAAASPSLADAASPGLDLEQQRVLSSHGFLSAHPDLRYRREGVVAYQDGEYEAAADYFRRAARYADKASQAMYAEMLWNGIGVPRDHALAYVWMDLAAERGYRDFLVRREYYWSQLSEAQREHALEVGRALYEEYGDAAAKPRLEKKLRLATRSVTGSRVGFVGNLQIVVPTPTGSMTIDGNTYYDERFWEPEQYWAWQDQVWGEPRKGKVTILPMEVAEEPGDE
jgi:hypothetical protein